MTEQLDTSAAAIAGLRASMRNGHSSTVDADYMIVALSTQLTALRADQITAAMALPEVRALVDAVNVTTIIAHALDDGYIDEKVEDQFRSALDEINAALAPIYAALAPFGKATE